MNKADETIRYALACRAPMTQKMIVEADIPESVRLADEKSDQLHESWREKRDHVFDESKRISQSLNKSFSKRA